MTIPSWAKIGAKVVLVDAGPGDVGGPHDARVGDVCIIDDVDMLDGEPVCLCHEENGRWIMPDDTWARLSRFRPLTSTKTEAEDVALFRRHLTKIGGSTMKPDDIPQDVWDAAAKVSQEGVWLAPGGGFAIADKGWKRPEEVL